MEIAEIVQNGGLVLSGGLVWKLLENGMSWLRARNQRTEVSPTPLPVEVAKEFVTCDQCRQHREEIGRRVDAQLEMFARVSDKLDLIEAHNEDRAKRMHDRLDPVIRSAAETSGVLRQHLEDHRAARTGG